LRASDAIGLFWAKHTGYSKKETIVTPSIRLSMVLFLLSSKCKMRRDMTFGPENFPTSLPKAEHSVLIDGRHAAGT
jgi:hypothetical protein